jgi:pimeloyl-ACP methyl ester carboxylesterase
MPNARLHVHEGAGHTLWLDDPKRVAGEIGAFLTG